MPSKVQGLKNSTSPLRCILYVEKGQHMLRKLLRLIKERGRENFCLLACLRGLDLNYLLGRSALFRRHS